MKKPRKFSVVILIFVIIAGVWGIRSCRYRQSYASDLRDRPWAYSEVPGAPLLVGKWEGKFTDPGGVEKEIRLEIVEPVTEAEREKKANRRARKRKGLGPGEDKRAFDGTATVSSRLGQESYEVYGHVGEEDHHQLTFRFRPQDENKRVLPNFTAREVNPGLWKGDELTASIHFTRHEADGSSNSTSKGVVVNGKVEWQEDPDEKPVSVVLKRAAP